MTNTINTERMTLRELVDSYEGTGFIIIDEGSESSGPTWVEWDEITNAMYGGIAMMKANPDDKAYEGVSTTIKSIVCDVRGGSQGIRRVEYVSDWIDDGQYSAPYGYKYRIIF